MAEKNWLVIVFTCVFLAVIIFLVVIYGYLIASVRWAGVWDTITGAGFLQPLAFTLMASLTATALSGVISLPSAYILARCDFPGKGFTEGLLQLPVVAPPLVSGLALLLAFSSPAGQWLADRGIRVIFSPGGVVVAQFFIAFPFALHTFKVALAGVPVQLEETAATLGDGPWKVFARVTLPLSRQGILAGLLQAWARAMGEFGATIMLAGTLARYTETLSIAVYLRMSVGELDQAVVIAVLMMLVSLLVIMGGRKLRLF